METSNMLIIALCVGVVEAIKQLNIDKKLLPLISMLVGILLSYLAMEFLGVGSWREVVINGLVIGLSASGLYSGAKEISKKE